MQLIPPLLIYLLYITSVYTSEKPISHNINGYYNPAITNNITLTASVDYIQILDDNRSLYCLVINPREYLYLLTYPNKIESININGIDLFFSEEAKLPIYRVFSIIVYTCIHKYPVLIRLPGYNGHIFYIYDPATSRWTNYIVPSLNEYKQEYNSTLYYRLGPDTDSKLFVDTINKEWLTLPCTHNDRPILYRDAIIKLVLNKSEFNNLLFQDRIRPTAVSSYQVPTNKLKLLYSIPIDTKFILSIYRVNNNELKYPNKLSHINYNDMILEFANTCILPNTCILSFEIYITNNNYPILIRAQTEPGFIFFAFNFELLKWTNYIIPKLDNMAILDSTGITIYRYYDNYQIAKFDNTILLQCQELLIQFKSRMELDNGNNEPALYIDYRLKYQYN